MTIDKQAMPDSQGAARSPAAVPSRRRQLVGRILLVPAIAIGVVLAWQSALAFSLTGLFQNLASQFLGAEVDNRYSGGPVLAKFRDRAGDDNGAGSLEYPLHESFQAGHVLDLLAYAVHRPVVADLPFVPDRAYWQIDFTLAELGAAVIHAYIDLDGAAAGSTDSADGSEGVAFDLAHPWDLFVEVDVARGSATLREADNDSATPLSVYTNKARKTVLVRIPLDRPSTKRVLDGRSTWHYVMVGAWDEYSRGHFMPVGTTATLRSGGGAESRQSPRVYDWLAPEGTTQAQVLATTGGEDGSLPVLIPVAAIPGLAPAAGLDEKQLAELELQAKAEQAAANERILAEAKATQASAGANPPPSLELASARWVTGDTVGAEAVYDALLAADPDNLVARAQKGTLISARCLTAKSLDETISYVNQAFVELDRAWAAAARLGLDAPSAVPAEAFAQLCLNVPEVPFGRSRAGAEAFKAAALWHDNTAKALGDDPTAAIERAAAAQAWLMAGLCFEKAQGAAEAETVFLQASSVQEMNATTRLELAKRGYY